jgi:hypothetical protein
MFNIVINQFYGVRRLFKANAIFYVLSVCVLTAFLVIMGILFILQSATVTRESHIKSVYEGKQLYHIVDNFYDADAFYEYKLHPENINCLGRFYNMLVSSPNLKFISTFNQAIPIQKFRGDGKFSYNSQAFMNEHKDVPINVKAMQLNTASFELYQLRVARGASFDWREVDYSKDTLPILLGSDYDGVYDIGDTFVGNYYGRDMTFKVIGILEPNTFIYYKGDPEFYLDTYFVVPYPKFCAPVESTDFHFEGILYFAMVNGDIMTTLDEKLLLSEVKNIANTTGFVDFSIIGISDFAWKYDTMVSVIKENQRLLFVTMLLVGVLVTFVQYGMGRLILARRLNVYKTYWLIGNSNYRLVYFRDISVPYIVAFLFSVIIIRLCFHNISLLSILFILGISVSILGLVYAICRRSLRDDMLKLM